MGFMSCTLSGLIIHLPAAAAASLVGREAAPACVFSAPSASGGCLQWDLGALPPLTWLLNDSYPEPYLISSPCALADYGTHCGASAGSCAGKHSPGLQLAPGQTAAQQCSRCFALGDVTHTAKRAKNGLTVTTTAGADHRTMDYTFICDRESSAGAGPEPLVVSHGMEYSVTWRTPLACSPTASPGRCPAPPPPPPTPPLPPPPGGLAKPTAAQLRWMEDEIGAIGHFNMGTFEACGIGLDGETTAAGFSPSLALSLSRSLPLSLSRSLSLYLTSTLAKSGSTTITIPH